MDGGRRLCVLSHPAEIFARPGRGELQENSVLPSYSTTTAVPLAETISMLPPWPITS
jgi:hypothetical protein